MSDNTKIEWTDATWNPITGCSVVSPGCTNCYAMKLAGTRLRNHPSRIGLTQDTKAGPVWNGQVRLNEQWIEQPLSWARPRMIFVCAHGDLFHDDVQRLWITRIFGVMVAAHHLRGHIFQVLTKRALLMAQLLSSDEFFWRHVNDVAKGIMDRVDPLSRRSNDGRATLRDYSAAAPPPFIWLGVSVEDQRRADERIALLTLTPAVVRWLSCEPLLGSIDLTHLECPWDDVQGEDGVWRRQHTLNALTCKRPIHWVVAGGESGHGARPMHPDWARSLRDQCAAAGTKFFFKQWGNWAAIHGNDPVQPLLGDNADTHEWPDGWMSYRVDKKMAGRLLDGREHNEFPSP